MKVFSHLSRTLILCAAVGILAGCATASKPDSMVAVPAETLTRHAKTVSVSTLGGKETSSVGKSQVSDAAFAQALIASIEKTKVFSAVVQGAGANYMLSVAVVSMDQPSFGLSFTVKMETAWTLKKADGSIAWQEVIKAENTATTSDAFVGVERLRIATEGAARKSIEAGLLKISKLSL
ncbi:hypothetical protein J2X16_003896 [Pelomonas aquatica]|uniref:DUF4410 domain-containing protein n=1 Tax=Pelomonas aquatica TaxID=431058 RepID=A0ABU1ZD45_9BURK|nr:hypothetical protein [Pelomonas aquatica]MDR7298533.1 hypothetical protein [Pelomonas aquatica]